MLMIFYMRKKCFHVQLNLRNGSIKENKLGFSMGRFLQVIDLLRSSMNFHKEAETAFPKCVQSHDFLCCRTHHQLVQCR